MINVIINFKYNGSLVNKCYLNKIYHTHLSGIKETKKKNRKRNKELTLDLLMKQNAVCLKAIFYSLLNKLNCD